MIIDRQRTMSFFELNSFFFDQTTNFFSQCSLLTESSINTVIYMPLTTQTNQFQSHSTYQPRLILVNLIQSSLSHHSMLISLTLLLFIPFANSQNITCSGGNCRGQTFLCTESDCYIRCIGIGINGICRNTTISLVTNL